MIPDDDDFQAARELTDAIGAECVELFGPSMRLHREWNIARDEHEWTIFTKVFGRPFRFDVSLANEDVREKFALERAMHDILFQLTERHTKDIIEGFAKPYFGVAKDDMSGIVNPQGTKIHGGTQ